MNHFDPDSSSFDFVEVYYLIYINNYWFYSPYWVIPYPTEDSLVVLILVYYGYYCYWKDYSIGWLVWFYRGWYYCCYGIFESWLDEGW